jgi:hypothetical protein
MRRGAKVEDYQALAEVLWKRVKAAGSRQFFEKKGSVNCCAADESEASRR